MNVLGVSCFYHDAAAALVQDGMVVAAAEEERFSRKKHDSGFPTHAIEFCLRQGGLNGQDLDYVVFYEKPLIKFERILLTTLGMYPQSWQTFGEAMISWFEDKLWIKTLLQNKIGVPAEKIIFVEHHLAHAASSLFCSPFEEAAVLTIDGVGEWTTTAIGRGRAPFNGSGASLQLEREIQFPHSLGLLYSAFTAFLGFEVNEGEYKVMGMAAYGEPRFIDKVRKVIDVQEDGSFHLDMRYFSFHHSTHQTYNQRFVDLFGAPRPSDAQFITRLTNPEVRDREQETSRDQRYADIAASIQRMTEEVLLKLSRQAFKMTGLKNLCLAGGVALNSVANGRILREGPFEEIFVQPAAGDSGGALGAALYAYHILLGKPRRFVMEHAYLGQAYDHATIIRTLEDAGVAYEVIEDDKHLIERVVERLEAGDVVGWFEGGFEWGPRALGHRSILADPRRAEMKDIVNRKIKFREPFRPFAPAVPVEDAQTFFDLAEPERHYPARYMQLVVPVHSERGDSIPAVNHQGTARLQTVRQQDAPRYYQLIRSFGQATGVPVLLNTSFNLRGEPIVNTPAQALQTFQKGNMELLVLDNVFVQNDQ